MSTTRVANIGTMRISGVFCKHCVFSTFNVTTNVPAVYLGHILNNAVTVPSGVTALLSFGGGKTLIGLEALEESATPLERES